MTESSALREKRRELEELEQGRDYCDPALYSLLHKALLDDLAELGASPNSSNPIRLSTPAKPTMAERVEAPTPTEVLPAVPVEKTMPKTFESAQAQLDHLLQRLAKTLARGQRPYALQHEIRSHCRQHGLEVPKGAQKKQPAFHAQVKPAPALEVLAVGPSYASPAARIRALRSQALEILPQLEDLDAEGALAANEEMDLLAKTLVLGGHLIARRTA